VGLGLFGVKLVAISSKQLAGARTVFGKISSAATAKVSYSSVNSKQINFVFYLRLSAFICG